MNILLIDDHALFRQGLVFLLGDLGQSMTFEEANTCEQALQFKNQAFDLILLDLYMPGRNGLGALKSIRETFERSSVVIVSGDEDPDTVRKAIDAGATGYVPKSSNPSVMIQALRLVLAGGIYLPRVALRADRNADRMDYTRQIAQQDAAAAIENRHEQLTERQQSVLKLAVRGLSNRAIGETMHLSENTVKTHLSGAFKILNVKNRTEAVYALAKENERFSVS
jgi:DNA-binding NarL/FixJ family response regulator